MKFITSSDSLLRKINGNDDEKKNDEKLVISN